MIKRTTIICLFILVFAGFLACKKDNDPQLEPFVIKDITEYNPTLYYVNKNVIQSDPSGDTKYIDFENNTVNDLVFTNSFWWQHTGDPVHGSYTIYYYKTFFKPLATDSIQFSANPDSTLYPHTIGDTLNDSLNWLNLNGYYMLFYSWSDYSGSHSNDWNSTNPAAKYLAFRKRVNNGYKYGWILLYGEYGPSVIER